VRSELDMQLKKHLPIIITSVLAIVLGFSINIARSSIPATIGANPIPPQYLADVTGSYDGGLTVNVPTNGWEGCNIFAHNSSTTANVAFVPYTVLADGTTHQLFSNTNVGTNSWYLMTIGRNANGGSVNATNVPSVTYLGDSVPPKFELIGQPNPKGVWRFVIECGL
jgi:hypothetical protein